MKNLLNSNPVKNTIGGGLICAMLSCATPVYSQNKDFSSLFSDGGGMGKNKIVTLVSQNPIYKKLFLDEIAKNGGDWDFGDTEGIIFDHKYSFGRVITWNNGGLGITFIPNDSSMLNKDGANKLANLLYDELNKNGFPTKENPQMAQNNFPYDKVRKDAPYKRKDNLELAKSHGINGLNINNIQKWGSKDKRKNTGFSNIKY
jgi:hypothetical protein